MKMLGDRLELGFSIYVTIVVYGNSLSTGKYTLGALKLVSWEGMISKISE